MARRWIGLIVIVLVAAAVGFVVLKGRVAKEILVGTKWKTVSKITVSGQVTGANSDIKKSKITAQSYPKPPAGSGITSTPINGIGSLDYLGWISYTYKFDIPMERQGKMTYRSVNIFGQVIGKPIVRQETYKAEYQIIKLAPPAGWKVTPREYKVSKDMKKADFEMGREGK